MIDSMTMLSFRVAEDEANELRRWAAALGMDRAEILRDALHRHLAGLRADHDTTAWTERPLAEDERLLAGVADWGPAQDWSDWDDAAR